MMIKVCKLVATMVLMVATLSSCMNSSKLGLEDSWTVGQPHTKNLEIKQRFDEIHNFAPKGKHVDLVLKNLFLTCSIQPEGENPILERKEEYSDYDRHPEFRRINEGELITLPKSKEHAEAMIRVAQFFLATYE